MNKPQYVKFKNGSYVKISSRGYSKGYMLTGDVIRGREFADDNIQLRSMIQYLASRNGGVLKEMLNEAPDSVGMIPEKGSGLDTTTMYYYTKENVLTALTLENDSGVAGFSSVNNSVIAYTGDPAGDEKLKKTLEPFLQMFINRDGSTIEYTNKFGDEIRIKSIYGHYDLSKVLKDYSDDRNFDYDSHQRIRVFLAESGEYIFTMGGGDHREDFWARKNIIDIIIKFGGLDVTKLLFEVSGDTYVEWNDFTRTKTASGLLLSYDELFNSIPVKKPEPPAKDNSNWNNPDWLPNWNEPDVVEKPPVALDHTIKKKIYELNKKLAELKSDEHVKGARWSKQERTKNKLDLKNVEIEIAALENALKTGVTDIEKVVINTLDRLESENDGEVVPADVLYAELERKLSKYGTSAVQILQKLRSMGVDPKKALREVMEKYGSNLKLSELIVKLEEYGNKPVDEILKESTSIVTLIFPDNTKLETNDKESTNVLTAGIFTDPHTNKLSYVGFSKVNNVVLASTGDQSQDGKLHQIFDPLLKSFVNREVVPFVDSTGARRSIIPTGHYCLKVILRDLYIKNDFDFNEKIRVFKINETYYFTFIGSDKIQNFNKYKDIFQQIIQSGGIDTSKLFFEISTNYKSHSSVKNKTKTIDGELFSYSQLYNATGNDKVSTSSTSEKPKVKSEIEEKIYELNRKLSELKSESHVKEPVWNKQEKDQNLLSIKNVEIEIEALTKALNSGETDIGKVVIQTIKSLESDSTDHLVPADALYAELERKLSQYGTNAVQILQKLKSMGVDPKKALREIMEKYGENIKLSELSTRLEEYVNEDKTVLKETDINVEELDTLAKSFPDLEVSLTPYPSKQMVKLELLKARKTAAPGTGTAFMEALCEWADRNKILLTLQTGRFDKTKTSDEFKTTSSESRLKKFYKRFGFISNYGRVYRPDLGGNMHRPIKDNTMKKKIAENLGADDIYAEYVGEMRDEVPFMMGDKKYQYVRAKYPNGKEDIGVYAFQGDIVYTYEHFRKMYGIAEDVNKKLREIISKKVASILKESHEEKRTKTSGTVNVSGEDYDYVAVVNVVIHSGNEAPIDKFSQPEPYADADIQDFDVLSITPEPANDIVSDLVHKSIQQDIYRKGGWDLD